jgi:hypothetical protein
MVMSRSYALARDEIVRALTSYTGITTADGAVTRDSLIDATLIGATDWITEKTILIDSGPSEHQDKGASVFNPGNGEITFISPCTNRILAGTIYRVLNISSTELDVAFLLARMGTNTDAAGTTTLFAWFARLWAFLGSTSGSLWYAGTVTAIPGAAQFRIPTLAGLGAGQFIAGAIAWRAYVKRDAGGTGLAPQGQNRNITAYATGAGDFTTVPFAPAVDVGDEILILHPSLAIILDVPGAIAAFALVAAFIQTQTDKIPGVLNVEVSAPATVEPDTTEDLSLSIFTVDGIPLAANLTAGVISITRVRAGVEVVIIAAAACAVANGRISYAYTFPSAGADWQAADEYKAVFSGQTVTVGVTVYPLSEIRCKGRVSREAAIQTRTDLLAGLPGTNGNLAAAWGDGAEHDLLTIGAPLLREKLHLLIIGIANLVGNITIRLYTDVNGTERRIYPIPANMTFNRVNDAPAIPVVNSTMGLRNALRVTIQSDNAADNAQIVEYEYLREAM